MEADLDALRSAAHAAAEILEARPSDGSFLEATLEAALIAHLRGEVVTAQQRQRVEIPGWDGGLRGIDLLWHPPDGGLPLGIEVKISDVGDSLFDLLKVASAVRAGQISIGCLCVAATSRQWARGGAVSTISGGSGHNFQTYPTSQLLADDALPWKNFFTHERGPKPRQVPAHLEVLVVTAAPVQRATPHELRVIAVRPAGDELLTLDITGHPQPGP